MQGQGVALSVRKLPTTKVIMLVSAFAALDVVLAAVPLIPYGPSAGVLVKPTERIFLRP